jgi:hypothetical protein
VVEVEVEVEVDADGAVRVAVGEQGKQGSRWTSQCNSNLGASRASRVRKEEVKRVPSVELMSSYTVPVPVTSRRPTREDEDEQKIEHHQGVVKIRTGDAPPPSKRVCAWPSALRCPSRSPRLRLFLLLLHHLVLHSPSLLPRPRIRRNKRYTSHDGPSGASRRRRMSRHAAPHPG